METIVINSSGLKILRDKDDQLFSECVPSKMTPADIAKYGMPCMPVTEPVKKQSYPYFESKVIKNIRQKEAIINGNENKGGNEVKQLKISTEDLLKICRVHGTKINAAHTVAEAYGLTVKQAENQITHKKIRELLQVEAESLIKAIEQSRSRQDELLKMTTKIYPVELKEESKIINYKTKFYISTSWLNKAKAAELGEIVEKLGNKITYKWWENEDTEDQFTLRNIARQDVEGVDDADTVIVLLPGEYGTHIELGMALAFEKNIIIYNPGHKENLFYLLVKEVHTELQLINAII